MQKMSVPNTKLTVLQPSGCYLDYFNIEALLEYFVQLVQSLFSLESVSQVSSLCSKRAYFAP